MPWMAGSVVDDRRRLIMRLEEGGLTMSEACEALGISRKTGYKWRERYAAGGFDGLVDRSRAPLKHGRATDPDVAAAIVALKLKRPSWGPRKLVARLTLDEPDRPWPSASTAGEILKRADLVQPRRYRRRAPPTLGGLTTPRWPNHVWAVDHKGWVRLGDGVRCEPLTITDSFSRLLIRVSSGSSTCEAQARPWFEAAFEEYGLPEVIRSDNGPPFASTGVTGLTSLSAWWTRLGIHHERTEPGHPQQNGRHERFHLTLLEAMRPPSADAAVQAERFAAFRHCYNHERPHDSLELRPPASCYSPSPRRMPTVLPEPDYPREAAVRRVRSSGEIKWRGGLVYISNALAGDTVAVEETEDGLWQVRFCRRPLGLIDPKTNRLRRLSASADIAADL